MNINLVRILLILWGLIGVVLILMLIVGFCVFVWNFPAITLQEFPIWTRYVVVGMTVYFVVGGSFVFDLAVKNLREKRK